MVRNGKASRNPRAPKRVVIHPELHKMLHKQAIDEGQTLQERVHVVLCHELERLDLLMQTPDAMAHH